MPHAHAEVENNLNVAVEVKHDYTLTTPRLTNTYEHYVDNFSKKSLLNRATVNKFDKLCQNIIVQNGQLRRHNTET